MARDILFLFLGLILLWTPRSWLRLGKSERSSKKQRSKHKQHGGPNRDRLPGDQSLWVGEEFGRRRNWIDLLRAIAGGFAVMTVVPNLVHAVVGVHDASLGQVILGTQAGLLLTAVLLQMLRVEERFTLSPPIFFVLGLAFPVVGTKAALIGFFAVWAINVVLPNPATFLATYGAGIAILSVFLGQGPKRGVLMAGLAFFPPLVAVLFRRRLAQYRKKTKIVIR